MKNNLHLLVVALFFTFCANAQDVTTFAGVAGASGFLDGNAASAKFNSPHGICVDKQGTVYVADRYNNRIRKITTLGVVNTFAGSGANGSADGTGVAATFDEPWAIACDTLGNMYVADTKSYKIRKITSAGVVTTVAGTGTFGTTNGAGNIAQFGFPSGIAVTRDGSIIYVADRMTQVIRKIQGGMVSTLAGTVYISGNADGQGTAATFDHPYSICLDNSNNLIVADEWNNKIRKVTAGGLVTTVAGNGTAGTTNGAATVASFNAPWGVVVDTLNNIYVGDGNNYTIRKITPAGIVSTYSGINGMPGFSNGDITVATFNGITSLAYYRAAHCLFAGDSYNQIIRKIAPVTTTTITITSNSPTNTFCLGSTVTLTASPSGLSNYTFKEGATVLGTSATGVFSISTLMLGVHTITCSAIDAFGYPANSTPINITIGSSGTATVNPAGPISLCQGDSILLTASAGNTYHWSTGATTQTIYVKNAGSYIVTVTGSGGCSGQSPAVVVTLKPVPQTLQTANDSVCAFQQGQINVVPQSGVSFYWYAQPSGGSLLATGNTFVTPTVSITQPYYIEMHASNGCVNHNRAVVYVIVQPKPEAAFNVSLPASVTGGVQLYFYNASTGGDEYAWNFGDSLSNSNTSTLENPTHVYSVQSEYIVQLIATSQNGCADTVSKLINASNNHAVFVPTTFTPNNDGNNDIFRIRGSNIKTVAMNIFNQWGQLIYHADENKWDGRTKGDIVQNGTYVYMINVVYTNDTSEKLKGQITVIR